MSTIRARARSPAPRPHRSTAALLHIYNALVEGRRVTVALLSTQLEVDERSVRRYFAELRDIYQQVIHYDATTGCYVRDATRSPRFVLSGKAIKPTLALEPGSTPPVVVALREAYTRFGSALGERLSLPSLAGPFALAPIEAILLAHPREHAAWGALLAALCADREVSFQYRKAKPHALWETRRLQPWHLAWCDGAWMVIGRDLDRKAERNFLLARMREPVATEQTFTRPPARVVLKRFELAVSRFAGEQAFAVTARVTPELAAYLAMHPLEKKQVVADQPDERGWHVATWWFHHRIEASQKLLGCRDGVEVLEPDWLRTLLRDTALRIAALNGARDPAAD